MPSSVTTILGAAASPVVQTAVAAQAGTEAGRAAASREQVREQRRKEREKLRATGPINTQSEGGDQTVIASYSPGSLRKRKQEPQDEEPPTELASEADAGKVDVVA